MLTRARSSAHGQGAISYDDAARCWIGLLDLGRDANGRRRRTKVRGRTRAEVRDKLDALRNLRDAGVDVSTRTMTIVDLIVLWFERGAPVDVTENTIYNCRGVLFRNVAPAVGDVRVCELKSQHIEAMLDAAANSPDSRSDSQAVSQHLPTKPRNRLNRSKRERVHVSTAATRSKSLAAVPLVTSGTGSGSVVIGSRPRRPGPTSGPQSHRRSPRSGRDWRSARRRGWSRRPVRLKTGARSSRSRTDRM